MSSSVRVVSQPLSRASIHIGKDAMIRIWTARKKIRKRKPQLGVRLMRAFANQYGLDWTLMLRVYPPMERLVR